MKIQTVAQVAKLHSTISQSRQQQPSGALLNLDMLNVKSKVYFSIRLMMVLAIGFAFPLVGVAQEYRSSVVGTDFDFIQDDDPTTFVFLEYEGVARREMPDKTGPSELVQEAFVFTAYFDDGTEVDIAIDLDFETPESALTEAQRYAPRLGKLPTSLRRGVERIVVHFGEGRNRL